MMSTESFILDYIKSLPEGIAKDIEYLHRHILQHFPTKKLWFLDGKNEQGKVVSNPNIGYGICQLSKGKQKEFYQVGISATSTGISVYLMGVSDKSLLKQQFGSRLPHAQMSGYCVKIKHLKEMDWLVFDELLAFGFSLEFRS